jgi:hypothetical protein
MANTKSGTPRPFQTHYFVQGNATQVPDRVGHASSRIGAVRAAITKLRTSEEPWKVGHTAAFARVAVVDEDGLICNVVERRKNVVGVAGFY